MDPGREDLGEAAVLPLTASQDELYRKMLHKRLLVVDGPPGSGKTHFSASALLRFLLRMRRPGSTTRVLVTAMTHAAIENLLDKTVRIIKEEGDRAHQAHRHARLSDVKVLKV